MHDKGILFVGDRKSNTLEIMIMEKMQGTGGEPSRDRREKGRNKQPIHPAQTHARKRNKQLETVKGIANRRFEDMGTSDSRSYKRTGRKERMGEQCRSQRL